MVFPPALAQPGGAQVALADLLLILALCAWLVAGSLRVVPAPWLSGNGLLAPALLFVGVNAASVVWSIHPRDTVKFTLQLIEIVIVLPIVFATVPRSIDAIRRGLIVYIGITSVLAAVTAIVYLPHAAAGELEGQYLPDLNKNAIGSYVGAGLILAYVFWLKERRPRVKRALAFAVLIEGAGLLASVSRGSIIGVFFAIVAVSFLLRRRRMRTVGIAALTATLFLATFGLSSGVSRNVQGSYDSSTVRSYTFSDAISKIGKRPILGSGGGTYSVYVTKLGLPLTDPNNMFLLTWAEVGIAGMIALAFLLFRYGRLLVTVSRLREEAAVPAVAAGAVALSFFVHFQFDVTWTRGTTSLAFAMIGLMLAATRLAPAHVDAPASTLQRRLPAAWPSAPSGVA
jgi:hypothetical protein